MRKTPILFYPSNCRFIRPFISAFTPSALISALTSLALTSFTITTSRAQSVHQLDVRPDSADIKELVDQYAQSINKADSTLAYHLFAHTGTESFVHPAGFERGWPQINTNIYNTLRNLYSKRKWNITHERIWLFECAASVEIEWTMDVTLKKDNSALRFKGNETQLWAKLKGEWRLAQVHDSGIN